MKTLLLYDSTFGNTKQLARIMAEVLGESSSVQMIPLSHAQDLEVAEADWLLLGGPTQRHSLSPTCRAWLNSLPRGALDGMPTAIFDTRYHRTDVLTGSAAHLLAKEVEQRGATLLAPPQSFFVVKREGPLLAGEMARAATWAREVFEKAREWARTFQSTME
jgi:flavodoxin